jgi:long-chain-fatty-acid--CoA ligase ACSBG
VQWKAYLDAGLARANKAAVSNAQTVQKYTVVPADFSVPGGELTATLKLKRNVVTEKYMKELEAMYS